MRQKKALNVEIGERIRIARNHANVTQEQLAEMIDVSPQYVSDLERGVVGLSVATLRKICSQLNVSSDSILFQVESLEVDYSKKISGLSCEQQHLLGTMIDCFMEGIRLSQRDTN